MKQESQRDYNLTDAELCMFTSNLVVLITRDSTEFLSKGIDGTAITALEALGNAFEIFPDDAYYRADVTIAAEAKEAHRADAEIKIREIIGCARIKWGDSSAQVNRFNAGDMTREADKKFLTTARQAVKIAGDYLLDLAAEGLTQAMIDALTAVAQSMEDEMNNILETEALRDIKTQERVNDGNELYGFVARYCEIGKIIWQDVDEAKYNDYIIYHTTAQMPGKVQNMAYHLPTKTVSWDAAAHADDYQLERKYSSDPDWTVVYEGADTSVVNDPVTAGTWYYRCRGHNEEGYGAWSDELMVLIPT